MGATAANQSSLRSQAAVTPDGAGGSGSLRALIRGLRVLIRGLRALIRGLRVLIRGLRAA